MAGPVPSTDLVADVLAGRTRGIARLITRAEAGGAECRPALAEIYRHTGRAHVVGMTGVPGSGKSTLVRALAQALRANGRTVAVVAIDPSSPFSGGAILGDRIRMNDIAADPGIFIRSMATRGALGGLARATLDAVDLLDAAGFDLVIIETVGVGQDEVDVVQAAHTTAVISAPGLGDDIQAIKAGILEIADIHVVSKCDRADANKTVTDLKQMLMLGLPASLDGQWPAPVIATSAETGEGVGELVTEIDRHRAYLDESGRIGDQRRRIAERRTLKIAEEIIRSRFVARRAGAVAGMLERVCARDLDPHSAALQLLHTLHEDRDDDQNA
ncbi:MAG: methylmalonyl Co-A mutase-associated GTPase MeaB [Alphaproteobacteria bacterium]|jgi:LAO/AO transport system kinase|nr:methylmalonyl Co-A mutase-associated GTPase MeaB [Alphaproteobacteria bacterium]MDP6516494.1 methylmalonyl Co-A mutase-associated GTPase MeaB [Alphaproteobacteria bacterium]